MKRFAACLVLVFFSVLVMPGSVFAQRGGRSQTEVIEFRLASGMPRNSDWGRALDRIAAEWRRVTNNEVRLRVIHDGVEGGEAKMLSSLSADNIQAALFTSFGLAEICPAVMTVSVPFLIKNDTELDMVLDDVLPVLEDQLRNSNYAVVTWSKGGWVNVFSKEQVLVPDDLRRHKIATDPEAGNLNTAFKSMGFNMVETEMTDIGPKLANNMISAFYQTPAAVAPMRLHKILGNMLDKPIAPFLGAIVVNRVSWNKLSQKQQQDITRATRRIAAEFDSTMPKLVNNAITVMSRDGLKVNKPNQEQDQLWQSELNKAITPLLGVTFDRDVYQQINRILERARSGQ